SPFQVQVNNNFEANIMPGQTVFVPLGSYDAHVVSLIGVSDEFIDIDGGVQEVSLYPGSIANVNFEANRIMPAFGQAIFGNGEPVGNARVDGEGVIGVAVTDRNGYFQMEIDEAGTYTLTSGNMSECAFEIPEMPRDEVYLDLGVIRCGDEQVVDSGELNEG
ncbi:MAG: CS1-pili formation C-terminal domain-containing protein, partial [Alphaproteobacteria bacterium]